MITEPSDTQILNAQLSGWDYLGDGMFMKDEHLGYWTDCGWIKE